MNWVKQYWGVLVGGALVLAFAVVFLGLALVGWPALGLGDDTCVEQRGGIAVDGCYCEQFRSELVKQPINTFSNFGFIFVGMVILAIVGYDNGKPPRDNPMNSGSWIAVLFGLVVIFLGPGSMVFHASMTAWAGFIDSTSMFLLLGFLIGYDLRQVARVVPGCLCWLAGLVVLAVFMGLAALWPDYATLFFAVMVVLTVVVEVPIWFHVWRLRRGWLPLVLFLVTFLTSLVIWGLSKTDGWLCAPTWILQGHAFWHLGSAAAMAFLFWYLRSETGGRPVAS